MLNQFSSLFGRVRSGGIVAAAMGLSSLAASASAISPEAERFIERADDAAKNVLGAARLEDDLFPIVAAMDDPPTSISTVTELREFMLVMPDAPGWNEVDEWINADAQIEALGALQPYTDLSKRFSIGIGHGVWAVDDDWAESGLYVGLKDASILANPEFAYIDKLLDVVAVAQAAAANSAARGDGVEALDYMRQAVSLSRAIMMRPYVEEKIFASELLLLVLERACDIVHAYPESFGWEELAEFADQLKEGTIRIKGITVPTGDTLAMRQAVEIVFAGNDEADEGSMLSFLATANSEDWQPISINIERHADRFDTNEKAGGIAGQYMSMWETTEYARIDIFAGASAEEEVDRRRFALLAHLLPDMDYLIELRGRVMNGLEGTRAAIGIMAWRDRFGILPPKVTTAVPLILDGLERDRYSVKSGFTRRNGEVHRFNDQFQYFVPVRDQPDPSPRDYPPFEMMVVMPFERPSNRILVGGRYGSLSEMLDRAEAETLTPFERRELVKLVNDLVLQVRDNIPTNILNRVAEVVVRNAPNGRDPLLFLMPDEIDGRAMDRVNRERERELQEQLRDRNLPARQRRELQRRLDQGVAALILDEERQEVQRDYANLIEYFRTLGLGPDSESVSTELYRLFEWYSTTDAGVAIDDMFEFDIQLIADLSVEDHIAFLPEDGDLVFDLVARGEPVPDEVFETTIENYSDYLTDIDTLRNFLYLAQSPRSSWNRWYRIAKSPEIYWLEEDLQLPGVFMHDVTNTEDLEEFILWSVGVDENDNDASIVGVGGADTLFWPPLLSIQRQHPDE